MYTSCAPGAPGAFGAPCASCAPASYVYAQCLNMLSLSYKVRATYVRT